MLGSIKIWWHYRTLLKNIYPELKAKASLECGNYIQAIYWLGQMVKLANNVRFSPYKSMEEQQVETRAKMMELLGTYHLQWIIMDERIRIRHIRDGGVHITFNQTFWGKCCNPYDDHFWIDVSPSLEEIANCALHKIGNLLIAKRAFELRGLDIPDHELLKYAKMCANELDEENARTACLLVKGITPLAAYQQCYGPDSVIHISK